MRTALILVVALWAGIAHAKVAKPASTDVCLYVMSLDVIQYTPRVVAPQFRRVSPQMFSAMRKVTRRSVVNPRYDAIYEGTDTATNRIKYAGHVAYLCSDISADDARKELASRLHHEWETMRKMPSYQMACCWDPTRIHKLSLHP